MGCRATKITRLAPLLRALFAVVLALIPCIARGDELADGFGRPGTQYHAMTWWHWMQGNISREGITADLEAMKQVGIQGAYIFHVGQLPIEGNVKFMSPEWWGLMKFATTEAARLDLKLGFHNCPGWSSSGGPWIKPEQSMQKIVWTTTSIAGPMAFDADLPKPKANWSYYRDITVLVVPADHVGAASEVLDVSGDMSAAGHLRWQAPAGKWNVLRIGHTTTGAGCSPAPPGAWGLECDKLDRSGAQAHYQAYPAKILANAGDLAGKTLTTVLIDSYEVGDQNWTDRMPEQFRKRRGYELKPWLAAVAGQTIGSDEQTARFKRDLKQTVADLFADEYYAGMRDEVHKTPGLQYAVEPYTGPFETSAVGPTGDIVMGEFWNKPAGWYQIAPVASVAHVNGKKIVAAEALTGQPQSAKWAQDPYALKSSADRAFVDGVNLMVLHTTAHQPWMNAKPGMTMGWWGTHFGRTQTWWDQSQPWFDYLARCQYMLQQGLFVADVLQLDHERGIDGYRADACGLRDLDRVQVRDGLLTFPDGMTYRVLELPDTGQMLPPTAKRIRELVMAGATVVGQKPSKSPSLDSYPACDAEVADVANSIWGDCDGKKVMEHRLGRGKVLWGPVTPSLLKSLGVPVDVGFAQGSSGMLWLHRQRSDASIYFISNQKDATAAATLSLRGNGRPELWHPDTGEIEVAPYWRTVEGRTEVKLTLDPSGSVFVVLRGTASGADPVVQMAIDGQPVSGKPTRTQAIIIRRAVYGAPGDEARSSDVTAQVRRALDSGDEIRASNDLAGDPAPFVVKELRVSYELAGSPRELVVSENEVADFPGLRPTEATAQIHAGLDGKQVLESWKNGTITLSYASGKTHDLSVSGLPEPAPVVGRWNVKFPAGTGAPAGIDLATLVPLNEHADPGVRHFSGTATYSAKLAVPADMLTGGRAVYLDLGEVRNLAEVRVNSKPLGILWKPPFRVDVTSAVHAGENALEVRITNLWPNRLIGDEQLPDDCKWGDVQTWDLNGKQVPVGRPLAKVPEWLLKGQPRPSAGRITFTAYKFYEKDSPLLRSGLIGPVLVRCSERVTLPSIGR